MAFAAALIAYVALDNAGSALKEKKHYNKPFRGPRTDMITQLCMFLSNSYLELCMMVLLLLNLGFRIIETFQERFRTLSRT